MEFGALYCYQIFKKSFMISLCVNTSIKRQNLSFPRYSLPWQRNKHTPLSGKKSLIDIHNISKYIMVQISNFFSCSAVCKIAISPTGDRPHPRQFSGHFTKKSYRISVDIMDFLKLQSECRLKISMIALVPPIGTETPILGVLAHGLIYRFRPA